MFMGQVRPLIDSDSEDEKVQRPTKSTADSESDSESDSDSDSSELTPYVLK